DATARDGHEALEQCRRLGTAVGLDHAHDHVDAVARPLLRSLEHRVGLSDARRRADEDLEAGTPLPRGALGERLRGRPPVRPVEPALHDTSILDLRPCRHQHVERNETVPPARTGGTVSCGMQCSVYASTPTTASSGYAGMPNSGTSSPSSSTSTG